MRKIPRIFQETAVMGASNSRAKPGLLAPVGVRDILRGKCGRPTAGQRGRSDGYTRLGSLLRVSTLVSGA